MQKIVITILMMLALCGNFSKETVQNIASDMPNKNYVSHAGGRIKGHDYTNSKEAILNAYELGYRLIEVDIEWTTDDKPVLLHSWDGFITKFFGANEGHYYSYEKFKGFTMLDDLTQLTFEDLVGIIKEKRDMYIVTDVKRDNFKLMSLVKYIYPEIIDNIIPQVYSTLEYTLAKELGYTNIILTLYLTSETNEEIINFAKNNPEIFAVTMPKDRAESLAPSLKEIGVYTYVHTINDITEYESFKELGIDGIYTDILID